MLTSSIDISN